MTTDGSAAAEDVAEDDDPLRQPFGARGAHVVVADHLEHGRAREARQQADVERGEHERRQHEMVERLRRRGRRSRRGARRSCRAR